MTNAYSEKSWRTFTPREQMLNRITSTLLSISIGHFTSIPSHVTADDPHSRFIETNCAKYFFTFNPLSSLRLPTSIFSKSGLNLLRRAFRPRRPPLPYSLVATSAHSPLSLNGTSFGDISSPRDSNWIPTFIMGDCKYQIELKISWWFKGGRRVKILTSSREYLRVSGKNSTTQGRMRTRFIAAKNA